MFSRIPAESPFLFDEVRGIVNQLGYSDEEAHKRADTVGRELFHDLGYSEEQTDNKIVAVLSKAERLK